MVEEFLTVTMSWNSVDGASGYELDLNGAIIDVNGLSFSPPSWTLEAGNYNWRVRAVDEETESAWSESRNFSITAPPTFTATPSPTPDIDFSGDGHVARQDVFLFVSDWQKENSNYSLTGSNAFDKSDLLVFRQAWIDSRKPTPTPVLPPPQLLEPVEGRIFDVAQSQISTRLRFLEWEIDTGYGEWFRWSPVVGADLYDIRFEGPPGSRVSVRTVEKLTEPQAQIAMGVARIDNSDAGIYQWQVRSGSSELGQYGEYSSPAFFEIYKPTFTPTPTTTPFSLAGAGDINQNGDLNVLDIFRFAMAWQQTSGQLQNDLINADLDESGEVNEEDLLMLLGSYKRRGEERVVSPQPLSPENGKTYLIHEVVGEGRVPWRFGRSPGAALYQYELIPPESDSVFGLIQGSTEETYDISRSPHYPLGTWQWRVRAYGSRGRVSRWSDWWEFTVISIS